MNPPIQMKTALQNDFVNYQNRMKKLLISLIISHLKS